MGDDLGLTRSDGSPWAGDVPPAAPTDFHRSPAPREPTSEPTSEPSIEEATEGYANVDGQPRLRAPDTDGVPPEPSASRTKVFVAVAVLGVAALGAASLIAGRDDASSATFTESSAVPVTTPPPVTDSRLEPVESDETTITTDGRSGGAETVLDDRFVDTGPATELLDVAWAEGVFAPPAALVGATAPTTVVVASRDGVLRELDLSTGSFVEIQIGSTFGQNQILVGRSSTLVSEKRGPSGAGTAVLYRAGEPPIVVGGDSGLANFAVRPNSDSFVGFIFGAGPGDFRDLVVTPDGTLEQTPANLEDGRPPWLRRFAPNGNELLEDGGSVFEEQPDGTVTLLTGGELLVSSSHHLLVRECDEAYECTSWLIDGVTGERRLVQVGPEFVSEFVSDAAQISPDGSKLWFPRFDVGASEYIMDLETGEATDIGASSGLVDGGPSTLGHIWTADGTGIIRSTGNALEFVDATTGERTEFGNEFAGPIAFGVRLDLAGATAAGTIEPTDTGIQIAGFGDGGVHRIDVDSGEIVTVEAAPIGSSAPVFVMPDLNGVSVVAYDNVDGIRVEGDVATPITDGPFGGPMVPGPRPDTLWVPADRSSGGLPAAYELFDSLGQPLGGVIRLPKHAAAASGADGTGGIVSQAESGGAFVIDQTSVERITTGELLALGSTVAIADECDESYTCGVVVIDRLTGERSPFVDLVLAPVIAAPPSSPFLSGQTVAPSGDVALLYDAAAEAFVFADLVSGDAVMAPTPDRESTVVWSDDGRAAVYVSDGQLHVFERSRSSVRALDQLPRLRSFAALPAEVLAGLVRGPSPVLT